MKQHKIYTSKGESDEVNYVGTFDNTGYLVHNLAHYHKVSEEEMKQRLMLSTAENPVNYHDEIYWTETE